MQNPNPPVLLVALLVLCVVAEVAWSAWRGRAAYDVRESMGNPVIMLVSLAFATATISAPLGEAQATPRGGAFTGTWSYVGGEKETKARQRAIEAATNDKSVFIRGKARDRLGARTAPARTVALRVAGKTLEISRGAGSLSLTLGGAPLRVERDGNKAEVSARLDGERIVVESKGDSGQRVATYALSSDEKRLTISVRMNGERLKSPLVYASTYARK